MLLKSLPTCFSFVSPLHNQVWHDGMVDKTHENSVTRKFHGLSEKCLLLIIVYYNDIELIYGYILNS